MSRAKVRSGSRWWWRDEINSQIKVREGECENDGEPERRDENSQGYVALLREAGGGFQPGQRGPWFWAEIRNQVSDFMTLFQISAQSYGPLCPG